MSAGTAYGKRYPGGFVDLPSQTTKVDSTFLDAVETALLQLIGAAPTVDGQVAQWDNANTRYGPALLLNKNIDPAAAIDKSKLNLAGQIGNADIAGAAGISRSKLNFGAGLVDADISAAAALLASKISGYPTDVTKYLAGDGTWPGIPTRVLQTYAGNPLTSVKSTIAETDLFGGAGTGYSLAGAMLGTTKQIEVTIIGDFLNNTGGTLGTQFKLYYGANHVDGAAATLQAVTGTNRYPFVLKSRIVALGAANLQSLTGGFTEIESTINQWHAIPALAATGIVPIATDSTTAQNVRVTVINGSNSALIEVRVFAVIIGLVG